MALLEGFESIISTIPQDYYWSAANASGVGSSSNVTEGIQSYRVNSDTSTDPGLLYGDLNFIDLTGVTTLYLDYTIVTIPTDSFLIFTMESSLKETAFDATVASATGSGTLEVDISGWGSFTSLRNFNIRVSGSGTGGYDIYIDNLRDNLAGGGTGKIKLGNVDINKIYLGVTEIKKVYLGSQLVHSKP